MTDEKRLKLLKGLKISYYIFETIIILSPLIFWLIAHFIDINIVDAQFWKVTKYAKLKMEVYKSRGEATIAFNELITGWHFGLLFISIVGSIAGCVILNLKRLLTHLRSSSKETKENIKNKNIMAALDAMILKNKIKELEAENENKPREITE